MAVFILETTKSVFTWRWGPQAGGGPHLSGETRLVI